jgi:hypothetical protein
MRFTLTYLPSARAELAQIWLTAKDRQAVTASSDSIELTLRHDPDKKGAEVEASLRSIVVPPLVYYYLVSPEDRLATVWSVRWAKS